jgi:hypothetical protein
LIGATATVLEETLRLPQTILTYPMTLASQVAGLVMKMQQDLAELVIKGDETLEQWFPPKDEQPEWATFDEDLPDDSASVTEIRHDGTRLTEGRFALYSTDPADAQQSATPAGTTASTTATAEVPGIVEELGYEELTLAQLRARLTSMKLGDLESLLAYEEATKARAPFQTLLSNRITRMSAK